MTAVSTVVMALFHARQNKPVKGYQLKKNRLYVIWCG